MMRRDFVLAAVVVIAISAVTLQLNDPSLIRHASAYLVSTVSAYDEAAAIKTPIPRPRARMATEPSTSPLVNRSHNRRTIVRNGQTDTAVALQISGGLIGIDRRIELMPDGTITAVDARSKQTRISRLSDDERTALQTLLSNVMASDFRISQCRDCITYELTIARVDSPVTVRVDDIALPRSNAGDIIRKLEQIFNRVFQGEQQ